MLFRPRVNEDFIGGSVASEQKERMVLSGSRIDLNFCRIFEADLNSEADRFSATCKRLLVWSSLTRIKSDHIKVGIQLIGMTFMKKCIWRIG